MKTTLNEIREHSPCRDGWSKLLAHLGKTGADDEPLSLLIILESNGFDDALWCLRALPASMDSKIRLLACDFAERSLKFVPEGEHRPRLAIEAARAFSKGEIPREAMDAASVAARFTAKGAAWHAAWAAARASAWGGVWDIARAVAWGAASAAAKYGARDAEFAAQTEIFKRHIAEWEAT